MHPRVVITVLDGVGVGALPDAVDYGDAGSDTLGNLSRVAGGLDLPNLARMGLGRTGRIEGVPALEPAGAAGRMAERSPGKDTLTGHWELAGLITTDPVPTYPEGFPPEMLRPFEEFVGCRVLGNKAASGTVIIEEVGEEHLRTGRPIVYTSADSVFQVAAHEDIIEPERLYRMCEKARELYKEPPYLVGRVIARPFVGSPGSFRRTAGRHDYSLPPPGRVLLEDFAAEGLPVTAVGKVKDIFAGRGITRYVAAGGNDRIVRAVIGALEAFDRVLPELREAVLGHPSGGLLVITADHGCDPTTPSTDHSREYVPVLLEGTGLRAGVDLGTRTSFADLAATVAELAGLESYGGEGLSFAREING